MEVRHVSDQNRLHNQIDTYENKKAEVKIKGESKERALSMKIKKLRGELIPIEAKLKNMDRLEMLRKHEEKEKMTKANFDLKNEAQTEANKPKPETE